MRLAAGHRLGPYEILAPLGAGGMGEVYRARDTRLDRVVAVKVLLSHLSENPERRQRFEREARAVSSLNHPHICTLHDIGSQETDQGPVDFLVLEHLEGETLAARLERGALPVEELLPIALQIADALDKAHRQGLVHRDLKPGNVMLAKSGAKLLDFGLAKSLQAPAATGLTAAPTMTSPLTAEGTIVGTFQYMAPEQLDGKEADARSDVFAFGALLYEMATGRKAFEGRTQASLIAAILKETPRPLREAAPASPPALDRLIRTCLEKDPEDRRQTMRGVLLELRWIAEGGGREEAPAAAARGRARSERLAWTIAAAAVLAAAAAILLALRSPRAGTVVVRSSLPLPAGASFHLQGIQPGPVAVSPDGARVALVLREAGGGVRLWVRPLDQPEAEPLRGTEDASYPFWSPDGKTLGYFARGALMRIDASGGPAVKICDAPTGKGGTWNRDGVILFAPAFDAPLHKVHAAGGQAEPVTELDRGRGENSHRFPQFLPDGRHFIYLARGSGAQAGGGSAVKAGEIGKAGGKILMHVRTHAAYASGHLLFVQDSTLMARPFDAARLDFGGDPAPVAENVRVISGASRGVFSASDNGVLLYDPSGVFQGFHLTWVDRSGRPIGALGEPAEYSGGPAISPDGRSVAVDLTDPASGTADIWIIDVQRGVRTRFTFDPGAEVAPVWSPDGRVLAYSSNRRGQNLDLVMKPLGGSEEIALLDGDTPMTPLSWSSDGRHLAYAVTMNGSVDIWALPLEGERRPFPVLNTRFSEFDARFSPDGRWIACVSDESGLFEVYVVPFPPSGAKIQVSSGGGLNPRWRGDGREIYFQSGGRDQMAAGLRLEGGRLVVDQVRTLFTLPLEEDSDVTRDGRRFLAVLGDETARAGYLNLVLNWPAAIGRP
jgi:Tol biopolymer transport system component